MIFSLIPIMIALARMAGGGLYADKLPKPLPEILFGLCFGFVYFLLFHSVILSIAVSLWCYLWMETGHGSVLHWQGRQARKQFLTPVVDFIYIKIYGSIVGADVRYCRLFMAVKGFLIGLPVGGLPLALLWPLSYEIGNRRGTTELAEYLTGFFSGLCLVVFYITF